MIPLIVIIFDQPSSGRCTTYLIAAYSEERIGDALLRNIKTDLTEFEFSMVLDQTPTYFSPNMTVCVLNKLKKNDVLHITMRARVKDCDQCDEDRIADAPDPDVRVVPYELI